MGRTMRRLEEIKWYQWLGYILLAIYVAAGVSFFVFSIKLMILPVKYLAGIGIFLLAAAVIVFVMHGNRVTSVLASALTIVLAAGCVFGVNASGKMLSMMDEVTVEDTPTTVPKNIPDSFVMYLSGIDTYGNVGKRSRSDVNILAVVNTETKKVLLLSTPRDAYVEYLATQGAKDKLTHAGIYGVEASMDALERLYDVGIDYYVKINFTGFIEVVDALGGIEVHSDYDFSVGTLKDYKKGYNKLNGIEALAFARERYSFPEGDYQRAKNQMEVIKAVVKKCASSSMLANYGPVMDALAGSFETNMLNAQIAALVRMQLSDHAQWEIISYTTEGTNMQAQTYSMPGQELDVIQLSEESIAMAQQLIENVRKKEENYEE